ncbi:MAG: MoxR family ATPase [Planctomycetes bacterium]|nr:MoxR family ATPase [Planctomycetota bacterium]
MDSLASAIQNNVSQVLIGKRHAVGMAVTTLLAGGHLLIEDRPGVGKTLLARALARSLDLPFQRVQCTADLLPTDILGGQVYHPQSGELTFRPGPVFTSVLVADELNRTPPRTQSALLECMQERRVTIERTSYPLPEPFFVVATQNPLNYAGTYPLPESQLDRFLMRINLGYPEADDEIEIIAGEDGHRNLDALAPVATVDQLRAAQAEIQGVRMERDLIAHIVDLAHRTRTSGDVTLGVSARGTQALHRACRARAVLHGRDYVTPEDIRVLVKPVFLHRMRTRGGTSSTEAVFNEILENSALPA